MVLADENGHAVPELEKGVAWFGWEHRTYPLQEIGLDTQCVELGHVEILL
jgi:hypothetical protein